MKSRLYCMCAAMALAVPCFAAGQSWDGTWKLNEAKSKLSPGAPKNNTVEYEVVGQNVKVTIDGVGGDGKLSIQNGQVSLTAKTIP